MTARRSERPGFIFRSIRALWVTLITVGFTLGVVAILLVPLFQPGPQVADLEAGSIASETIFAPADLTYVSDIETERARADAAAAVDDQFEEPDPRVAREQVQLALRVMAFVETVREDSFADTDLRVTYVSQIVPLSLQNENAQLLVTISDMDFEILETEVVDLLENAMSGEVREGRVDQVTANLPLRVSTSVPESIVPLVLAITGQLIEPNSRLDTEATQAAVDEAVALVQPVELSFRTGEAIVRAGERVTTLDIEALEAYGLMEPETNTPWQPIVAVALLGVMTTTVLGGYISMRGDVFARQPKRLVMFAAFVLVFLLAAQFIIPGRGDLAYLFPLAALAMAFASLLGLEYAALIAVVIAALTGYMADRSLEIALYNAAMGLFAAGSLRRNPRLNAFFVSGVIAALAGIVVILVFRLPTDVLNPAELGTTALVVVANGMLSAGLALLIMLLVGNLTETTTSLQLIDLTRPDHPLQRTLQQEAIGTYHHTLAVANLAEAAADAIEADSLLTRVGILYHDIGKTTNPGFFIENRIEGVGDTYENLSPLASARIIKSHVSEGVKMAKQHRLPAPIIDFIEQHHGTRQIVYFLRKAQEEAEAAGKGPIDEAPYTYEGPKPQSRETGIALLADACESATRAQRPSSGEEIARIVDGIIRSDIETGQLDDSGLSLTDISTIREEFIRTLKGMYHPRIKYPEAKPQPAPEKTQPPPEQPAEPKQTTPAAAASDDGPADTDAPAIRPKPDQPAPAPTPTDDEKPGDAP